MTQIKCTDPNKAPQGCTQWLYGKSGVNSLQTFNYDNSVHLANQKQIICVRREIGNCQICWNAASITDVQIGGKNTKGVFKVFLSTTQSINAIQYSNTITNCSMRCVVEEVQKQQKIQGVEIV